jgi:hypothetical protein
MKLIVIFLTLFIFTSVFSQTPEEIEEIREALSSYRSGEIHWGTKKDKAYRLLIYDKYNYLAIKYLITSFEEAGQIDSISYFFDNLIRDNINDVEPFLLRELFARIESLNYSQRINSLKKTWNIDSTDVRVNYLLGKLYYELFIKEFSGKEKKANLDYYARNSKHYFIMLCHIEKSYVESLKFPLIQLLNYLEDISTKKQFENNDFQASYFPVSAFVGLPDNWETDYNINVIDFASDCDVFGIESALFHIEWYSKHLYALNEPVLVHSLQSEIFRFTYLRTFDNPIVVGLENNSDTITLYWKVSYGAGGYEPGRLIINQSKELSLKEWNKFKNKVESVEFWNIPTIDKGVTGEDGAHWILEGENLEKYHVVDRWNYGKTTALCVELLKMTDLSIDDIDIY